MNPTTPPVVNGALSALRGLLIAGGALLAGLHYEHSEAYKWIIEGAGATMVIGPLVWGVYVNGVGAAKAVAAAVQAGINLAVTGRAVDEEGKVISRFGADAESTPPKQVTVASAQQIVSSFGPATSEIAKK